MHRVLAAGLVVAAALAGCLSPASSGPGDPVEAAREAAAWLEDPRRALAAGYEPAEHCVPGEGVHWINEALVDTTVEPRAPEALLFAPTTANATDPDRQRLVGVEYVAVTEGTEHNTSEDPPTVAGHPMEGPAPGAGGGPWHATLHAFVDGREDPHARDTARVPCHPETLPPGMQGPDPVPRDEDGLVDAARLPACEGELPGERVHEHPRLAVHLDGEVVDLSPERYQLAARPVHVEGGARDAHGATVHVHEARPSLACFLATLGWHVEDGLVALDTGEVYRANATHRFTVLADGEPAEEGFQAALEGDTRYEVHYDDETRGSAA